MSTEKRPFNSIDVLVSDDSTVYLQIHDEALKEHTTIEVMLKDQQPIIFPIERHISCLHGADCFRARLGALDCVTGDCVVSMPNVSSAIDLSNASLIKPPFEAKECLKFPDLSGPHVVNDIEINDARYDWTDDDLWTDAVCEEIVSSVNEGVCLNASFRPFIKASLGPNQDIYVTLTTNPERLKKLHYTLRSLDLTLVTNIFIVLPVLYQQSKRYQIPTKLLIEFPKIKLVSVSVDLGPCSKIVPAIEYVRQVKGETAANEDIFISIDDDNAYNNMLVDTFAYYSLKNPRAVITGTKFPGPRYSPFQFGKRQVFHDPPVEAVNEVSFVEGFTGVAYKGYHIDTDLIKAFSRRDPDPGLAPCYYADDLVISFTLQLHAHQICSPEFSAAADQYCRLHQKDLPYFTDAFAIHLTRTDGTRSESNENFARYSKCLSQILRHSIGFTKPHLPNKSREEIISDILNHSGTRPRLTADQN